MSNDCFPFFGSNLSCVRQIDFVMQSFIVYIINISVLLQISIHECNGCRLIIKRTQVHNLNTQSFINRKIFC